MLLNLSVPQYKNLGITGGQAEKKTGCNNLLEHMKSAEELQIRLTKSDLQFSAQSVKLKYILGLVFTFYSDYFILLAVTNWEELRGI